MTGIKLDLISDINMHLFIEKGMRGGISYIAKRYSKANNQYMENYDSNRENNLLCTGMEITCMDRQRVNLYHKVNLIG